MLKHAPEDDMRSSVHIYVWVNDLIRWLVSSRVSLIMYNSLNSLNREGREEHIKNKTFFESNRKLIVENSEALADEFSRKTYSGVIDYLSSGSIRYLRGIRLSSFKQYTDSVIVPRNREVLIDVGAFFGESTKEVCAYFARLRPETEFYSLVMEPDKDNAAVCRANLKRKGINFSLEECAAGAINCNASFDGGMLGSSKLDKSGKMAVPVKTIDSICAEYGLKPTYIKYDIEGAEREALVGTEQTITLYRPRLAVSVYHSKEDLIYILKEMREKYPFYRFYVRHYSSFFAETVLYCIPEEEYEESFDENTLLSAEE